MSSRPRLLCTAPRLTDNARAIIEADLNVDYADAERKRLLDTIDRYHAWWLHFDTQCDAEILARAVRLRAVCTATTGTDHIDKIECARRNIRVLCTAKDRGLLDQFSATAEMAFLQLLSLMRNFRGATRAAIAGHWKDSGIRFEGRQMLGKTMGVLGLGRLGTMMARFAHGFGMRVLGCDKLPIELAGVTRVDFDTLLTRSDCISIHIHMTPENKHLFNRAALAKIKPGAVLVNTSRGDIVDEDAVIEALESGRLAGYGADVVHNEWAPDMRDNQLVRYAQTHDHVVLTPHIGGATVDTVGLSREFTARKLVHFLLHGEEISMPTGKSAHVMTP